MTEIITHELLRSWSPCTGGYKRFCELFPEGTDLKTAIEGLVADVGLLAVLALPR